MASDSKITFKIFGQDVSASKAVKGVGDSTGQAEKKFQTFGQRSSESLSRVGMTMTKTVTPAALAFGAASYRVFQEYDAGTDAIVSMTGATGEALEGLTGSMGAVARQVPQDLGQVGKAIGEVNTRLGLTGQPLEQVSKKFLDLARLSGGDVVESIGAATRVFGDWGVIADDQGRVLDMLYAATQQTGIGFDRLSQLTVQYGAPLRQLGFGIEETVALFGKWEKEGVNIETAMAGMRRGLANFAKDGKEPAKALADVQAQIKGAGSAAEANRLAIETFGARAGPDMAAAIREGRFEIGDMVAALEGSSGSIDSAAEGTLDFADKLKMAGNWAKATLGPYAEMGYMLSGVAAAAGPVTLGLGKSIGVASKLGSAGATQAKLFASGFSSSASAASAFSGKMGTLGGVVRSAFSGASTAVVGAATALKGFSLAATAAALKAGIVKAATAAWTAVQWLFNAAMSANPIGLIVIAIAALIGGIILAYNKVDWFRNLVDAAFSFIADAWGWIVEGAKKVWEWLQTAWANIGPAIITPIKFAIAVVKRIFEDVKRVIGVVINVIKAVWEKLQPWIVGPIKLAVAVVKRAFEDAQKVIGVVVKVIKAVWEKLQPWVVNPIKVAIAFVRMAFNQISTVVRTVVGAVRSIWARIQSTVAAPVRAAVTVVRSAFSTIAAPVRNAIGTIRTIFNGVLTWFRGLGSRITGIFSSIWSGIASAFKGVINAVIGLWNRLSFTVPKVGPFGGFTIGTPDIPYLAEGGIVTGPTLAMIGEGRESEAVIPLSKLSAMTGGGGTHINITVNGALDKRATAKQIRDMLLDLQSSTSRPLGLS